MRFALAAAMLLWPALVHSQGLAHDHAGHGEAHQATDPARPSQPGQGAFAAIQEIVEILEADPGTDWSKVNIGALREHLVDMSNVTLMAVVASKPVEGGLQFSATGQGAVIDSIRRMLTAHAATMNGADGWTFRASNAKDGAILTVLVPPNDLAKLHALGFFGVMTRGMHHPEHHLMLARGGNPHQ